MELAREGMKAARDVVFLLADGVPKSAGKRSGKPGRLGAGGGKGAKLSSNGARLLGKAFLSGGFMDYWAVLGSTVEAIASVQNPSRSWSVKSTCSGVTVTKPCLAE